MVHLVEAPHIVLIFHDLFVMEVQAREQCPQKCSVRDRSMRPRNPFTGEGHHNVAVLEFGRHAERGVKGSRVVECSSTHMIK